MAASVDLRTETATASRAFLAVVSAWRSRTRRVRRSPDWTRRPSWAGRTWRDPGSGWGELYGAEDFGRAAMSDNDAVPDLAGCDRTALEW